MAGHKRRRPKSRRAGCAMCKFWKQNGVKGSRDALKPADLRMLEEDEHGLAESGLVEPVSAAGLRKNRRRRKDRPFRIESRWGRDARWSLMPGRRYESAEVRDRVIAHFERIEQGRKQRFPDWPMVEYRPVG